MTLKSVRKKWTRSGQPKWRKYRISLSEEHLQNGHKTCDDFFDAICRAVGPSRQITDVLRTRTDDGVCQIDFNLDSDSCGKQGVNDYLQSIDQSYPKADIDARRIRPPRKK
jgi:hypothetical protein